jgi:hypothetical protein
MTTPLVGISPESALAARPHLFAALQQACDVRFVAATQGSLAATVHVGEVPERTTESTLVLGAGSGAALTDSEVTFTNNLDGHLRGWTIADETLPGTQHLEPRGDASVLATVSGLPVWTTETRSGQRIDHAALIPEELTNTETLRSRITPGRFLALLPLVAFLRKLEQADSWQRPPVRASFIMDDPNLHTARYGYIDYEKTAVEAKEVGFHLSVAMIPLDAWFSTKKAREIFRASPNQLSLVYHGNNHTKHELGAIETREYGLQLLAQGVRRMYRFEQRTGIPVAKVMAAPHGRCSEQAAWAMARLGFEAICMTRPFPWLDQSPPGMPLTSWFPGDTSSVMPTLHRMPMSDQPEELPLRAFLGQPIVLYGHDPDLGPEPDLLARWTGHVSRLDAVSWASVGDISREQVSWRSDGATLWVRPHTRHVRITAPAEVKRVVVEGGGDSYETVVVGDGAGIVAETASAPEGAAVALSRNQRDLTILTQPATMHDPKDLPGPRWSPWPPTRRLLTEARDRVGPIRNR